MLDLIVIFFTMSGMILKQAKKRDIPRPSAYRLCRIYNFLSALDKDQESLSSQVIAERLGYRAHSVRKDISYCGEAGTTGSGYEARRLKTIIEERLELNRERRACIIGLDVLGRAIIDLINMPENKLSIVSGFDRNINVLETLKIDIPLYPSYDITEIVERNRIEIAIISDQNCDPGVISERLTAGGIKGIINFSSLNFETGPGPVFVRNIDLMGELTYIMALLNTHN